MVDYIAEIYFKSFWLQELQPVGDQFGKDNIPWEGPHTGAGAESDREGAAETKC